MPWLRFELWSFLCLPYERFSQMSYLQVYKSVTDVERVISFLFKLFVFSKFFIFSLIGKFVGKLVELFFSVFALQTCCFLVWVPFFSQLVCVSQSILSRLTTLCVTSFDSRFCFWLETQSCYFRKDRGKMMVLGCS